MAKGGNLGNTIAMGVGGIATLTGIMGENPVTSALGLPSGTVAAGGIAMLGLAGGLSMTRIDLFEL